MAINVSQAFHRTSANPVDESMALTKAQMLTVNDNLMPAYYFTVCQDDGYIYLYSKTNTVDTTTGKFRKFEGGSGPSPSPSGSVYTGTLLANGWNASNQQTLTFSGYSADYHGVVGLPADATSAQVEAYRDAVIRTVAQSGATVTFECEEIPSINLPVEIYCGGGSGGGGGTASLFTITVTGEYPNWTADKTPSEVETAVSNGEVLQMSFPPYGMTLFPSVIADGTYVFSDVYTEGNAEGTALASIVLTKGTSTTWSDITFNSLSGNQLGVESIQVDTMPVADNESVGKIYQYIGNTTSTAPIYVNGLFYKCVEDSSTSPSTYSWVQQDVQSYPEADLANVFASGMPTASVKGQYYVTYSPIEHVVGEWQQMVDGVLKKKPLYEKTVYRATQAVTEGEIIDVTFKQTNYQMRKIDGIYFESNSNNYCTVSSTWAYRATTTGWCPSIWQHANGLAIATGFPVSDINIIVQYTKTADDWQTV